MSNRRKLRHAGGGRLQASEWADFVGSAGDGFAQMARRSCSECDSPVRWVDAAGAAAHGLDVDAAASFFGMASPETLEWWICTSCDNGGAMGPTEVGEA